MSNQPDSPVPHPVETRIIKVIEEGQEITDQQRERVAAWLEANGIDSKRVPLKAELLVESSHLPDGSSKRSLIKIREYYLNGDGSRVVDPKTGNDPVTYERWVEQRVQLEPEPGCDV